MAISGDWLVLHVPFGARKLVCKSYSLGAPTTLRPTEMSYKKLAGKMVFHSFACDTSVRLVAGLAVGAPTISPAPLAQPAACAAVAGVSFGPPAPLMRARVCLGARQLIPATA